MSTLYTAEEFAAIQQEYNEAVRRNIPITAELARQMQDAKIGVKGFTVALEDSVKSIVTAGKSAASAAVSAGGGAKSFNGAIGGMTDAVSGLVKLIPLVGGALSMLTQGLGAAAKAATDMSDGLWKTYTDLSQVGIAGAAGDLHDQIKALGFTTADGAEGIQAYTDLLKENSESLARMAGGAQAGAQSLAAVATSMRESGLSDQFRLLGKNVTEQNKLTAGYLRLLTMSGAAQQMTTEQMATSASAYILQIDRMSRLTGTSADQLQKDAEMRRSQTRYGMRMHLLEQQKALEGPDGPAAQQIEILENLAPLMKRAGPEAYQGFLDTVASDTGRSTSEASRKLAMLIGNAATTGIENIRKGGGQSAGEIFDLAAQGGANFIKTFGSLATTLGKEGMPAFADGIEAVNLANLSFVKDNAIIQEEKAKAQQQSIMAGKTADGREDKYAKARVELEKNQLDASIKLTGLINKGIVPVTQGMAKLAKGIDYTLEMATKLAVPGGAPAPPAAPAPAAPAPAAPAPAGPAAARTAPAAARTAPATSLNTGPLSLASTIASHESGSAGYNAYNKGTVGNKMIGSDKSVDFSKMTIDEYLRRAGLAKDNPDRLFAVGKYQIIPDTMRDIVSQLGLDTATTVLDATTQELLFSRGLIGIKRPLVDQFIKGKSDDLDGAILQLAQEFASIGVPYPAGKAKQRGESYYSGIGGNKARTSPDVVAQALQAERQKNMQSAAAGGILSGPKSGYNAMLHGTEAVVPLPDGRTIPVEMAGFSGMITQQSDLLGMQLGRMDDLIAQMRALNATSSKMLQYAQG